MSLKSLLKPCFSPFPPTYLIELQHVLEGAVGPCKVVVVEDGLLVGRGLPALHVERAPALVVAEEVGVDVGLQCSGQAVGVGSDSQTAFVAADYVVLLEKAGERYGRNYKCG